MVDGTGENSAARPAPPPLFQKGELMKKMLFTILILSCRSIAHASEATHRAAAEQMLQVTKAERNIAGFYAQMGAMVEQQFKQMDVPEDAIPILAKFQKKQMDVMKEELSWQKLKDEVASAYMKICSEDEIREITKFFSSPIGVKYVDKIPELTQEMMKSVQSRIPSLTEKMSKIGEELRADLEKYDEANRTQP